jgi:hypothetical protein
MCSDGKNHQGYQTGESDNQYLTSVATVMTDVFHKNEINLLRKFAKFVRIFDKIDGSKNRGVI